MDQKAIKIRQKTALIAAAFFLAAGTLVFAGDPAGETKAKESRITPLKEVFDQNFYDEAVNQLDFGRWCRKIFRKKIPSADVNVFDQVPDNAFFTNRHGRQKLSLADLETGFRETEGPDLSRPLTLVLVEQRELSYEFTVEDARGDRYTLKFDRQSNPELNTAAEVIASRFYYAAGYNVPQFTILLFKPEQMVIGEGAVTWDNTGFKKKLSQEILGQYFASLPQTQDGSFRASAMKLPKGESLGNWSFTSRRKNDPQDPVNHRDRREIRALNIFSAWLNNYNLRESGTAGFTVTENGQSVPKYYITDLSRALGADSEGAKPPMFGYEYMADYGEAAKSFLAFGLRKKPWQKKWSDSGEKPDPLPAVGYFTNDRFDPAKYKVQLPYEAFRLLTRADGFWAARIIMDFSDEDIRAMVKAGRYTDPEAAERIAKILIERRDLIVKYWLSRSNPLDNFELSNGTLSFRDLAVDHGVEKKEDTVYLVQAVAGDQKKPVELQVQGTGLKAEPSWTEVTIRVRRSSGKESPSVKVWLGGDGIQGISRED